MGWFSNTWNAVKDVGKKTHGFLKEVGKKVIDTGVDVGKKVYSGVKYAHELANKVLPIAKQVAEFAQFIPAVGSVIKAGVDQADSFNNRLGQGINIVDSKIIPNLNPIDNYGQIPLRMARITAGGRDLYSLRNR